MLRMKDQDLALFNHGEFRSTEELPMERMSKCMDELAALMAIMGQTDVNRFTTMYRDAQTGRALGFEMINTTQNGIDCRCNGVPLYLECKSVSVRETPFYTLSVKFSDTNLEKARSFQDKKNWLAASVWDNNKLLFIVFGQNREIGDFLMKKVQEQTSGRSIQGITLSSLIKKYGFKVIAVSSSCDEVIDIITEGGTKEYDGLKKKVMTQEDFYLENQSYYSKRVFLEYGMNHGDTDKHEV